MASLQWMLDLLVMGLLGATLFHAVRLERALAAMKRDRAALDDMLGSFNESTRDAGAGIDRLRQVTETAGRHIARQAELGNALKDDLAFLIERGDRLADRMDGLIRTARPIAAEPGRPMFNAHAEPLPSRTERHPEPDAPRVRSQAERDLLNALRTSK